MIFDTFTIPFLQRGGGNRRETETNIESGEVDGINSEPKKSCRAVSLSAWLAFLSFTLLVTHTFLAWIKEMSTKEEFWKSAKKMIQAFKQDACNKKK